MKVEQSSGRSAAYCRITTPTAARAGAEAAETAVAERRQQEQQLA